MRLTSSGDASRSQIFWSHWEQGAAGRMAVLRYVVPEKTSHCAATPGNVREQGQAQFPAYQGEIAIVSELNEGRKTFKSIIVVEYGPVTIGDLLYICPVRSEALSKLTESSTEADGVAQVRFLTYLNDVSFTGYHVFRAEVRVLQ